LKTLRIQLSVALLILVCAGLRLPAQILTSSPYSRYGIGELNSTSFSALNAMGGAFSAYQTDSLAPSFINIGNPAGLANIRLAVLELGGQAQFSRIISASDNITKRNVNFSYGSLAFPVKRLGAVAFGIMPYSTVGYRITSSETYPGIDPVKFVYNGEGGYNKVFLGTGLRFFSKSLSKFNASAQYRHLDSLGLHHVIRRKAFFHELASELSLGATGNFIFGNIKQTTDVIYPGSITWYNTRRQRMARVSDLSANVGLQTGYTFTHRKRKIHLTKKDSLSKAVIWDTTYIDPHYKMTEKVKLAFGVYANLPTSLKGTQDNIIYNYSLDAFGNEILTDTSLNSSGIKGNIRIPLEIGAGFSLKKGDRFTFLIDGAITKWSDFRYFDAVNTFKNSYRAGVGMNYVPRGNTIAGSSYMERVQYRLGFTYSDGFLDLKNSRISNYAVTAGLGLPVGIGRRYDMAIVNLSAQFGTMGTTSNSLLKENYVRLIIGFTFNQRWFIKNRYD